MIGSFRQAWEFLTVDLWEPLAAFSTDDAAAPLDLFGDLYAAAGDSLGLPPTDSDLEAARNDPEQAREYFLTLIGTDFASESAIVGFLEAARDVIADYELPGYEDLYRRLLRRAIRKYNLRYRLDEPFSIRFLLPGSFANLYAELLRLNASDGHLSTLLAEFETAFDDYARNQSPGRLKACIAKASNYAEGLAAATHGKSGDLGKLCGQLKDWPHNKMRDALKDLYGFCSDYPGIRHGGTPANARRALAPKDLTLASLLLLAFSAHLSPRIDEQSVLERVMDFGRARSLRGEA